MYAQVHKNKPEPSIYSELGPGGRDGPKPVVAQSNYAEAKDIFADYSNVKDEEGKKENEGAYGYVQSDNTHNI